MRNHYSGFLKRSFMLLFSLAVSWAAQAQDRKVSGKITDAETGAGIPAVTVLVKGTSSGTNTDVNGNYTINVPANAKLTYSFVGYATQEITVGNRTTINVGLGADSKALEEVVVTGYAAQQKRDITGSVAIVDVKKLKDLPASNIGDQLQGRVAGVQVSSSGDPGSSASIRIRGVGSINQNEPLYVVDGIPVQNESNLNFLNPNDIESMQILKDAASAAIYGSRAANGVIVITTKKGKAGVSKINVDVWTGTQAPAKFPNLATPQELLQINQGLSAGAGIPFQSKTYVQEGNNFVLPDFMTRNGGFKAGDPAVDPKLYFLNSDPTADAGQNYLIQKTNKEGTDWFREIFKPASVSNVQLSASGGSEKGNYFFSGNYYKQNGILILNNYTRYQMRVNTNYNIKKFVRVGQTMSLAYQTTIGGTGNPNEGSPFLNSLRMPGIVPVYDINGYWGSPAGANSNAGNPVAQQTRNAEGQGYSLRLTGSAFLEVDFLKHFTAKTTFGVDLNTGQGGYYGYRNFEATEINSNNSYSRNMYSNRNWVWFNTISYNQEFGDHRVTALVGTEAKRNTYDGFNAGGSGLTFGDDPFYRTLNNTNSKSWNIGEYKGETTTSSLFAQASYNYKDKYLASGTVRRDGVSRFINNPYGVFPSGSVGWRISKEDFMKSITAVNDLKLTASYGIVGNNEIGNDYAGYANFSQSISGTAYSINGSPSSITPGFAQTSVANKDLKWETTKMLNLGITGRILNALDVTFEWYDRKTFDILYQVPLPSTAGNIGSVPLNIGDMSNVGYDISVGYRGKAVKNELTYGINFTAGHYKNTVLRLEANDNAFVTSGGSRIGDLTRTLAGFPISQFWGYTSDGVITSEAQLPKTVGDAKVGRLNFRDINGDGKIDNNDEGIIGSPLPKLNYGLNLTANYKGFDVAFFLQGVYGNQILNYVRYFTDTPAFQANYSKKMLYEAGITYPKLDRNDNYSNQKSSFYVEPGSYFRGKNLTLGYTLPTSLTSKIGLDRVRVYAQTQNLFTITKYSGFDPDVTISNITEGYATRRDLSLGIDYGRYPISRSFYFGANIEF